MITMRPNGMLPTMGYEASDEPPKPMSDDEIGERVAAFRAGLERRWDRWLLAQRASNRKTTRETGRMLDKACADSSL
jgi:hypothetical protein